MDARDPLAKGSCRHGHLWDHVCADQWAAAENSAFEPPRRCFARSSVDGFERRDDPERAYRAVNYDTLVLLLGMMLISAYLLSGALFRMGGRRCFEILTDAAAATGLSHT